VSSQRISWSFSNTSWETLNFSTSPCFKLFLRFISLRTHSGLPAFLCNNLHIHVEYCRGCQHAARGPQAPRPPGVFSLTRIHFSNTHCVKPHDENCSLTSKNTSRYCRQYLSVTVSNCRCEQLFSKMKNVKSRTWVRLTDEHLQGWRRIVATEIKADIERSRMKKQHQMSHCWIILLKKIIEWYMNLLIILVVTLLINGLKVSKTCPHF
jgi:hypothetical protein